MTAAVQDDLVNAALLGTDRRPVPTPDGHDAAGWLLDAAARRRAGRLVTGSVVDARAEEPAPPDPRPLPRTTARAVLDDLLRQGSDGLVDLWLHEALDAGVGVAPEHWTPLLDRARRSRSLDRRRLAAALGPRGLWFARHNPAWSSVGRVADADPSRAPEPTVDDLTALTGATPSGVARTLGVRAGSSVPLAAYASVTAAAASTSEPVARLALGAAEEVLWARWALAGAFDPSRVPPDRAPISQELS